jgi:hypothetical protein
VFERKYMTRISLTAVVCLFASVWSPAVGVAQSALPLGLVVDAAGQNGHAALVRFDWTTKETSPQTVSLVETTGGKQQPVAIQRDTDAGSLWWIASGPAPADGKRTYRLEAGTPDATRNFATAPAVTLADSADAVEARHGDQPLMRYNKAHVVPPPGVNKKFGRSAHLHPVWTPRGAIVTDELPPDHLHQSGIFLAYTKTQFEGRDVDFWNLGGSKGRVRFKELKSATGGPVFGRIQTVHEHVDLTADDSKDPVAATSGGKVALIENWDIRVWNVGLTEGFWMLDIASECRAATESPLKLPEYHYGGMALRAARSWTPENVRFFTSEGDERKAGNHTRPRWCDASGTVEGQVAGIALMTHPSNFRFPEPLRIHPTMPYMVYTPSFLGDWEIAPAQTHRSRYRFVIHDGQLTAESLDRLWRNFAEPLVARVR